MFQVSVVSGIRELLSIRGWSRKGWSGIVRIPYRTAMFSPCDISVYPSRGKALRILQKSGWALLLLLPTLLSAGYWTYETVDTAGITGQSASLALDQDNRPHVSYYDGTGKDLKYAHQSGGTWIIETVDTTGDVGQYTSLALDANGDPHIAYYDATSGDLKYARKSGDSWIIETVDTAGNVGQSVSLALDVFGNPHISYMDWTNDDLKYARKSGGTWIIEIVDTSDFLTSYVSSLKTDRNGNPHIAYYIASSGDLKYARKSGSIWTIEAVDTAGTVGQYASLALDADGNPHISYYDWINDDLKYARKSGSSWAIETVDTTENVGMYSSLALDAGGIPHIAYYNLTSGNLKYAYKSGSSWTLETVDATGDVGEDAFLALDANGNPHIAYHNATTGDLAYATTAIRLLYPNGGEVWHPGERQRIRWSGAGPVSIFFSPDGSIFRLLVSNVSSGAYTILAPHDLTERAVIKIVRDSFPMSVDFSDRPFSIRRALPFRQFHKEAVDTAGDAGMYTSLDVASDGTPHIAYHDYTNGDLKYAYRSGDSWVIETVDTPGVMGWYPSLVLDAGDSPHIAYQDYTNGDLKYAHRSGGTWIVETVDTPGAVGEFASLVLDANGNPHISYYDATNGDLKYARKTGGIWIVETVDTAGGVGQYTSIALDAYGNPHISYYDATNGDLKYARKSGGTWTVETVDAWGSVGAYTSIALDGSNTPHISYYDASSYRLKYARKSGGSWIIEIVDATGDVGSYSSIALNGGNPHISYYKELIIDGDLKYAHKVGDSWIVETVDTAGNVGRYTSLALDANGNPHIAYYDLTNGDLKYASQAFSLFSPRGGETWNVGAKATLKWGGPRDVDVYLSTQGGDHWQLLLSGISGTPVGDTWQFSFRVPHLPTRYARVKLAYAGFDPSLPLNTVQSDSFFQIKASVVLLAFNANLENNRIHLSWSTRPGPEDLLGFHLYRIRTDGSEERLTSTPISDTSFDDTPPPDITAYELGAVNGLGQEFRIGKVDVALSPLGMKILSSGHAVLHFFVPTLQPGTKVPVRILLLDAAGRSVRTLAQGSFTPGYHVAHLSLPNLPRGTYFLWMDADGVHRHVRIPWLR